MLLKLCAEGKITTLGALFKELDRIEIDTLITNSTFKVLSYNLLKHFRRIFNLRLVQEVKGKTT
jgi:hypothetical protein